MNLVDVDPDLVLCGDYQSSTAAELVRDHIDRLRDVEVIFALNDLMAFGVMQALHAEGVRVPHDIAVIGYDDTPLASLTIPKLTSVHQSREEIAFLACELLLDLIEQVSHGPAQENTPRAVAIQPRLVVRESSDRS